MRLGKHINELLHRYDCVIIPGFGGFVANYKPSRINPVKHQFHPPGKHVVFNRHLKNNDGLLANSIAMAKNCTFEEAMKVIDKEVRKIEKKLSKNELVQFKGVGAIHQDIDGNLIFETDGKANFLPDSFGLKVFQSRPILVEDEQSETKVIPITSKNELTRAARIAAAASIFVALFWIPLKTDVIQSAGLDRQFKQILHTEPLTYTPKEPLANTTEKEKNQSIDLSTVSEISFLDAKELEPESKKSLKIFEESILEKKAVDMIQFGKYQIVGGCFEFEDNAKRLMTRLQNKGYNAQITGKHKGLHVVSYATFNDPKKASSTLAIIKQNENSGAWLLVK